MRPRAVFVLIFLGTLATRLCHLDILWIEECYPAAGALQILNGDVPYRDFWYDKPPLSMGVYLLWAAQAGWPLRLAGAIFVTLISWLLYCFGRDKWGQREGLIAASLGAFFLAFWIPSAVMALAPDLLMIGPHLAAVYLAWKGRPFWSGLCAGVAMLIHTKGAYVLAGCLLWQYRAIPTLAAGFLLPNVVVLGWLGVTGALGAYVHQVWQWGLLYAKDTLVANPLGEAARRTLSWAGFHAALVLAAVAFWRSERDGDSRRFAAWLLISIAAVAAGWRFFPRYYFQLLPVMVLAGSRGLVLLGGKRALAVAALLVIPLVRFGPRYAELAWDQLTGQPHEWRDLAMYQGSVAAAAIVRQRASPEDTMLVWGYRPDLFVLTRIPAGTPYLDSQPLTGVIADRHLVDSRPSAPELARENRRQLVKYRPTFIVDGLGPYNPDLSIAAYPDLKRWLSGYSVVARPPTAVVYRLSR